MVSDKRLNKARIIFRGTLRAFFFEFMEKHGNILTAIRQGMVSRLFTPNHHIVSRQFPTARINGADNSQSSEIRTQGPELGTRIQHPDVSTFWLAKGSHLELVQRR